MVRLELVEIENLKGAKTLETHQKICGDKSVPATMKGLRRIFLILFSWRVILILTQFELGSAFPNFARVRFKKRFGLRGLVQLLFLFFSFFYIHIILFIFKITEKFFVKLILCFNILRRNTKYVLLA